MKKFRTTRQTFPMGALMASAAVGTRFLSSVASLEAAPLRYDDLMAAVLHGKRTAQSASQPAPAVAARRFDIPPGTLGTALAAFEKQTGMTVHVVTPDIRQLSTRGVSGFYTVQEALTQLLAGTGVGYRLDGPTAVSIDLAGRSEVVDVVARMPPPVVSSPKFTTPLRDIPQTISVIPAAVIEAQGATTLREVLRNVPGVTFQAGEGGGGLPGDTFTMRGFSAGNDLFIDGVRDTGGYSRDAFNVEQVEVVKGPSSSISGRGSTGGTINQVTKSPNLGESRRVSLGGGSADFRRGTFDLNQPLRFAGDAVALRLNGMWTESGVPGRDVVENAGWGLAPSLALGIGSPTTITLKSQHLRQDNVPDYGLPWGTYPGYPTGAFEADPPVDQSSFYGLRGYDFENIDSDVATIDAVHRLAGPLTLRNVTRYSDTGRDSAITAPRPPNRQLQRRTMTNENLANQTTLTVLAGGSRVRHELVTGFDLARERTGNRNSAQAVNQPATTIVNPNPDERPLGPMPANAGNPSNTRLDQVGLYAFDTAHLGERWQVTGGVRWDAVDVDYDLTTLATGEVTRIAASDRMLSWRGGVVYKPAPNGSVYAGLGTSFNPSVDAAATGAALSAAPTAANNPNLDPEETRNYEVGTKWDVAEGRLALTAAVFRTEKVNARTRNANSDPFVLSGRQRVGGVELSASGTLAPGWTALASYAFLDSEIEASANAAEEGQNLAFTPESTFNLWSTYSLPRGVVVGGGVQYMDSVFRNTLNTLRVPSYWVASALVSYEVNRNLTLRLNALNLADAQYVDRVGGGHYIPGPRRQVMLTTDVSF